MLGAGTVLTLGPWSSPEAWSDSTTTLNLFPEEGCGPGPFNIPIRDGCLRESLWGPQMVIREVWGGPWTTDAQRQEWGIGQAPLSLNREGDETGMLLAPGHTISILPLPT